MPERFDETDHPKDETAGPGRRQLLVALGGAAFTAAAYGIRSDETAEPAEGPRSDDHPASEYHIGVMTAVAEAIYPSAISVDESFIENHVFGRVEPRPGHFEGLVTAIEAVDSHAKARFGDRITDLSSRHRRQVLQSMGVTQVHPTADGTTAERVRFYLVNDLLFALFTAPVSSELTGIDNPPGHPGGRDAYQRGPGGSDR